MAAFRGVKYALIFLLLAFNKGVKAQLTADFSASPISGCAPLLVNFTDKSTGSPVAWKWDLGNGTISFLQNPSVTYFNPGQYTIKLVVYNAGGDSATVTKQQYITIYSQPTVAFTGSPLMGCFPLPVNFTDQSIAGSGTITQWQWDLGDGNISSVQNPSHIYTTSGNYNITLRVTNNFGCSKLLTKNQYVQVTEGVNADFSSNTTSACQGPLTVNFQNLSTPATGVTYQWLFGDGGASTAASPSHTYAASGAYTVRLIVTNSSGCRDTIEKTNYINVGNFNASFTVSSPVCATTAVNFTNTSAPVPVSVAWDFGDATTSTVLSPSKIYAAPGTYTVRLIADFGGCSDTTTTIVTVLAKPTAGFNAPVTNACRPPLTVNFNNTSTGGVSYRWNFGDGTSSTSANPSHTYTTTGLFTVTLIATGANGCTDTLVMPDFVKIQAPSVTINNLPVSNCAPLTWTFGSTVNSVDPVISYLWDFGDGSTSTLPNPSHTFPAGQYDIKLIITTAGGCTDTAIVRNGITASIKPNPNFSATPRDVCAFQDIRFTDLSTGTVTSWHWDFGDGGTSNDQNPIYAYQDTGLFDVTLIVCNAGCCDTLVFQNYIHISPPIANFSAPAPCTNKRFRQFTDLSLGADEWFWDFGDGTTSTLQNPSHTYSDTGLYAVRLVVRNLTTGCTHFRVNPVRIIDEKANFTNSADTICKYTPVTFNATGNKVANVASFQWDFGDGITGAGQNTVHTYTQSGKYSVRLIVTDIQGCTDTLIKNLLINVNGPTAAFTPGTSETCLLTAIQFADSSKSDGIHPITSWIWNYGDGIIETLTAPPFQHLYSSGGNYTVRLRVIDNLGCYDSATSLTPIIISDPTANFASVDTVSCPARNITFNNTSTGPGNTYLWYFGDGTTSTQIFPVHQYSADGIYTVRLYVTDMYGCTDSLIRPNYIRIVSPRSIYTLSDTLSTCPPLLVNFVNNSQNYTSLVWDFGDGSSTIAPNPTHFYTSSGVYVTRLTVTSPGGCVDVSERIITVRGPQGTFTYTPLNGCKPLQVNFVANTKDRVSFIWDFNDGSTNVTADSILTYTYTIPGSYVPKMILLDSNGCVVPVQGPDTIRVSGALAKFDVQTSSACDQAFVTFKDSSLVSNDIITSYAWDFGDGNISSIRNPVHHYTSTGMYYPKLVVRTQNGCIDSLQLPAPVKIVSSPQVSINNAQSGCASLSVNFAGQLALPDTSAIVNWYWNLGNGNTSNLQNPPTQIYNNPGIYNIQLIAENSSGCKDTVSTSVEAYVMPKIDAGSDVLICRGSPAVLNANGATSYTWSPTNGLSCSTCPSPQANPDTLTKYTVWGTTINGCTNVDTIIVDVKQRLNMFSSIGDTMCRGGSVRLYASGAASYTWSPSTGLNSTTNANPLASPSATTTYQVIGRDDKNCFTDTGYVQVKVYPIPTIDAGQDQTISGGQSIELKPTLSPDIVRIAWTQSPSIIARNGNNITVQPKETTTYTVEGINEGGCRTRDNVTIYVICDGSNVYLPNTFTPNGDGINDVFFPRGKGLFNIKTLRIFSRWGEVMYEKSNFSPNDASSGWDGTFKGKVLNPDVYVYTIDIVCENSTILTLKGNVALLQ